MKRVAKKTITRSLLYIRILEKLIESGTHIVSSKQLADMMGLSDVKIRKDISNFGKVGRPRIGYKTFELKKILEDFVLQNIVHAVLFGVGNLGSAILKYPGFHQDRIKIVAAFDKDKSKVGKKINGVSVYSVKNAVKIISKTHAEIGIIAVPEKHSQNIADVIVSSGVKGIVNFSPISISVPEKVFVRDIDLSIEFLSLMYEMRHK
ncbi:MAG: redox-sensing transcriptional repressor Rex [Candidatus Aureabacteria bacterium]|nr:redox-sensing transcriptional repressor Rex [Candidatus Auribacterota bacterium]